MSGLITTKNGNCGLFYSMGIEKSFSGVQGQSSAVRSMRPEMHIPWPVGFSTFRSKAALSPLVYFSLIFPNISHLAVLGLGFLELFCAILSSSWAAKVIESMEEITGGLANVNIADAHKKNRIQVSNTKKPLFFYVNLAKVEKSTKEHTFRMMTIVACYSFSFCLFFLRQFLCFSHCIFFCYFSFISFTLLSAIFFCVWLV